MAMLAEPKRKRKWALNPRGKFTLDENNVGQKLLEKMGWSKGKGLGRNEQGDMEPIRLRYKNDAEGVGYEAKNDQWMAHHDEFNNILSALNGKDTPVNETEPIPIKSLEVRSKSSKSRVHYHKFTRGKDLSRYSAADMASILGKRANVDQEKQTAPIEQQPFESSNGSVEHKHGVTTIQRGNVQEYFAAKMAAAKHKQLQCFTNEEQYLSLNDSINGEKRVRINEDLNIVKEFCSKEKILKSNQNDLIVTEETAEETQTKKKKKKSKTKLEDESNDVLSEPLPITEEVLDNLETKKKKKKKKERLEEIIPEPVIEEEPVKVKKSKKRNIEEVVNEPEVMQNGEDDANTPPEPKKKKKKSKKQEEEEEPIAVEVIEPKVKKSKRNKTSEVAIELVQNEEEEPPIKKKKKKSEKNEEEAPPEKYTKMEKSLIENEPPIKKKKKKSEKNEEAPLEKYTKMENSLIENEQTEIIQNGVETEQSPKKKKKKNKKENVPETFRKIEEIEFESKLVEKFKIETTDEVGSIQNVVDVQVSKKKKKNKKDVIETLETSVQEDKTSQDAQVNSTKERRKKSRVSDVTDKVVAVNGEGEDVGDMQSTKETSQDKKNIDKKVCSADQLTCEADAKPDDALKELDLSRIKDKSTISSEENAKTEGGNSLSVLESQIQIQVSTGTRISQKLNRQLMKAQLDKFIGSNLLSIVGYGVFSKGGKNELVVT